jgi:hypothetical protein
MTDCKPLLFAEFLVTLMMAGSISGIMSVIASGPTPEWRHAGSRQSIIAWPIAFALTLFVRRPAFGITGKVFRKRAA